MLESLVDEARTLIREVPCISMTDLSIEIGKSDIDPWVAVKAAAHAMGRTTLPEIPGRVVVWFSCGAASAVAAKMAIEEHGDRVVIAYCAGTLSVEHPDNIRFLGDCEEWFGRPIYMIYHSKYDSPDDVWVKTRWIVGVRGAACTRILKKDARRAVQSAGDLQVFGLTSDERGRIERFERQNPDVDADFPLADAGLDKADCYRVLRSVGIAMPAMYELGFNNNNCIGCPKGGAGYWRKIREHFPHRYDAIAKIEADIGHAINRIKGEPVFLPDLPADAGRDVPEPEISCGVLCDGWRADDDVVQIAESTRNQSDPRRQTSLFCDV